MCFWNAQPLPPTQLSCEVTNPQRGPLFLSSLVMTRAKSIWSKFILFQKVPFLWLNANWHSLWKKCLVFVFWNNKTMGQKTEATTITCWVVLECLRSGVAWKSLKWCYKVVMPQIHLFPNYTLQVLGSFKSNTQLMEGETLFLKNLQKEWPSHKGTPFSFPVTTDVELQNRRFLSCITNFITLLLCTSPSWQTIWKG